MSPTSADPIVVYGLRFDVAGFSEQGPRSENQDAFSIDDFSHSGIVAVADGMGGERSGRVAADTALQTVVGSGAIRSLDDARRVVRQANASVTQAAERDPEQHEGMGCALGFLALASGTGDGTGWIAAHVGDVRILSRSPDGTIRLETRDHTPAFAKWEAGEITLDEIPDTAGANRLQRAVGRGGEADVVWLPARPGWSWLLISDGIYKVVRLDELARIMDAPTAAEAVEVMRAKVEERGPEDNFTAVLIRALGGGAPAAAPHENTHAQADRMPITSRPPARSSGGAAALVLALLALAAAGAALWMAWQGRTATADREQQVEALRVQVDSLATTVQQLSDPFGPSAGPPIADPANPSPAIGAQ